MTRYSHLRWLPALGGLLAAGVLVLSAAPSSATIVCPTGIKPPSPYCTNVPPTATTGKATEVRGTSATLNGVAGPNVSGGDITQYYFEYGRTTSYGTQTPVGTIGSCPAGISPPSPYCNVPKTESVSAGLSNLTPCTRYHFQLLASNPDKSGLVTGGDQAFTTAFSPPISFLSAPHRVRAGKRFTVKFTLRYKAKVKIEIVRRRGGTVATFNYGTLPAGRHKQTIRAPRRRGNYTLVVIAKLSCGQQRDSAKADRSLSTTHLGRRVERPPAKAGGLALGGRTRLASSRPAPR